MFTHQLVGDGTQPPWWRTVPFLLVTGFMSLISLVFSPWSWAFQVDSSSGALVLMLGLGMALCVTLPLLLIWRHRIPFLTVAITAVVTMVVPLGNLLPLVALACLIGRRRGAGVWWTAAGAALASTWVVLADAGAQPQGASFWKVLLGPTPTEAAQPLDLPAGWVVAILLSGLALSVASGLIVRSRREAASATAVATSAQEAVRAEQATSARLGDEAARSQERERIAREVHDAMGYRLSLLILHAGALETNSYGDPRVAESARLIRESAAATMDDLRSLLDVLRAPPGGESPTVSLADLATVVQESFGAGGLSSSIFIQDSERAHPTLARAVYRIVQEVLTNARKHAPGEPVFLSVTGSPGTGVVLDVRNRFPGGSAPTGPQRGLAGIAERVHLLGGRVAHGVDGEHFRVHVELPWREA